MIEPNTKPNTRDYSLADRISNYRAQVHRPALEVEGTLTRMVGLTLQAAGCKAAVGELCRVMTSSGEWIHAEVVGFSGGSIYLMLMGAQHGLLPGARVVPCGHPHRAAVGDCLLGRVIDGSGVPIDGLGPLTQYQTRPIAARPLNPLARAPINKALDTGVRAINGLFTLGRGQRIGLVSGTGVGKSSLLGMLAEHTEAEVTVVGLIGERGREVNEFVRDILSDDARAKSVVVAAPADSPPLERLHAAMLCTTVAEHFRDDGKHVLLLLDSLTRFAQAQREIGLSVGEPPATRGYPPSVYSKLAQVIERAGNADNGNGSITGIYTVLTEGDVSEDPIADAAKAILDGHIVLSRAFAEEGRFPAIDPTASISRVMDQIASAEHVEIARRYRAIYSLAAANREMLNLGVYQIGADPEIDRALKAETRLLEFLAQPLNERATLAESKHALRSVILSAESGGADITHAKH